MKFFIAVIASDPRRLSQVELATYERLPKSRGVSFDWHHFEHGAVLMAGPTTYARVGKSVAVGIVRLANRREMERRLGLSMAAGNDLAFVLAALKHCGAGQVSQFVGDFAFVMWDGDALVAIAATDPMGIKKLYYVERDGLCCFGSLAEFIACDRGYDGQYLAEQAAMCLPTPELTVYAGVRQVPPGCTAVFQRGRVTIGSYWRPEEAQSIQHYASAEEAVQVCRRLLIDSVRWNVAAAGTTWSHLSGGLDSSAIVSLSQLLAQRGDVRHGLAGTITFVDGEGTQGDEREYSLPVASQWGVSNDLIVNSPLWWDHDTVVPHPDQPKDSLVWLPRDQKALRIICKAGGDTLLTGFGGDELFTGSMFFFADWIAEGHPIQSIREALRWAAIGRVSFWDLMFRNAWLPLLPRLLREGLMREQGRLLPWIHPAAARRYGLRSRVGVASAYAGRLGRKYRHSILTSVRALSRHLDAGIMGEDLDVRYPFLYKPLIEFALALPPGLCARPNQRKWILREAMRGILPDKVRTRVGKGASSWLMARALTMQRELLEPLVRNPLLADLEIVDGRKFRQAFEEIPHLAHRQDHFHSVIQSTMTIEAWLQMRAGRWPPRQSLSHVA